MIVPLHGAHRGAAVRRSNPGIPWSMTPVSSSVMVVRGEPGVGRTALLEYAGQAGREFRVVQTVGVEGEMELPYAALQQLCSPILDRSERLADPQIARLAAQGSTNREIAAQLFTPDLVVVPATALMFRAWPWQSVSRWLTRLSVIATSCRSTTRWLATPPIARAPA